MKEILLILLLQMCYVPMLVLRTVFMVKNIRYLTSLFGIMESMIYVFGLSLVFSGEKHTIAMIVYAFGFGIGLHLGEVTYGNIGVPERLEFSVIGPAANEAARIEGLCKELGQPLLTSAELARVLPENWVSLGHHPLRGVGVEREIFTLAAEAA